ncbi:allantoate amidohydrolase [Nguyenibacter vanlangensis]|uniref:Allantoate amidohydrolase n=1 Tax=Nguyenibacter vanlangensis TaxID=1216886 RepID=A0ABZ3D6T4_9PROT
MVTATPDPLLRDRPSGARAVSRCDLLGEVPYSDVPGQLFRPYLGGGHAATLDRIAAWMAEAGMRARIDPAGNIVGRYEGSMPDAPALLLGSHVDSVRDAGRYDGMLGVMLGIETVAHFAERGRRFPFALEVIGFGDEEGSRFPVSMLCSRAVAGALASQDMTQDMAQDMVDAQGTSLADALGGFGLDLARFGQAARRGADVLAYVEAHIEQGPVLEAADRPLGVVSAIAAQYRFQADVTGVAGHAGTMAMDLRRDALAAAAEMVLAIERIGGGGPPDLVATVGRLAVGPGVPNVVPGTVGFTIDVRAGTHAVRDGAARAIRAALAEIAARRQVTLDLAQQQDLSATPCDPALTGLLEEAVRQATGHAPHVLVSGAGHDAMAMARLAPVGMLFLRCAGGISHNPAEAVDEADADCALRALTDFVARFAEARQAGRR